MAEIFISHATKLPAPTDTPQRLCARAIRDGVHAALVQRGHASFLDQRCLRPGEVWSARLQRLLGQCDGAVVVVDEQGLQSTWLRAESTILGWRGTQIAGFVLVPVFVGVTAARVEAAGLDWLTRYQAILTEGDAAGTIEAVAERFADLRAVTDATPMASWIRDVARRLRSPAGGLEEAARCLGLDTDDQAAFADLEVTLAHAFLHADPDDARRALEELLHAGLRGAALSELVRLIRPICVDAAAGASMHRLIDEPPGRPAIVNVADASCGRLYLDRARLRRQTESHGIEIDTLAGEGGDVEVEHALREALLDGAAQNRNMPNRFRALGPAEQGQVLDLHYNRPEKFFLLVGQAAGHGAALGWLRTRMPRAACVLLPGFDDAERSVGLHGAAMVEPRLSDTDHFRLLSQLTEFDNLEGLAG